MAIGTVIEKKRMFRSLIGGKEYHYIIQIHNSKKTIEFSCPVEVYTVEKGDIIELSIKRIGDKN